MCRLLGPRGEKEGERDEASLPVEPTIPRRLVPDFRTRRNERRTRGAAGTGGGCPRWKKKEPSFTSRSRANERDDRGVRGRVQIVFGGQG